MAAPWATREVSGVRIEIWSAVICPWCYSGKRRLETAPSGLAAGTDVPLVWRSFELAPDAPAQPSGTLEEMLAAKYGLSPADARNSTLAAAAGCQRLVYRPEQARPGHTFAAHRLLHLAAERSRQAILQERLFRAYVTDGLPIGDPVGPGAGDGAGVLGRAG